MVKAVYIHIPFCKTICTYCDFCKVFYNDKFVSKYLDKLEKEIKTKYQGEVISTLYIGGGTPSCLSLSELERLFSIISIFKKSKDIEFTIECNIESLDINKIKLFKKYGVNRVSIGVQSLNIKNIKFLGRHHTRNMVINKIFLLRENGISNINIDLIYALRNQSILDLKEDLDEYLKLGITHISTYSLMIEPNTKLYIDDIKPINEELDSDMYKLICSYLKEHNFKHYEISNFSLEGYESKHNLTYWNNEEYYGFGVGASGYINNVRYDNTRSITTYLKGIYLDNEVLLDKNATIENEFILGFRKIKGINKNEFKNKYNKEICDIIEIKNLLKLGRLEENAEYVFIPEKYLYISNAILVDLVGGSYE